MTLLESRRGGHAISEQVDPEANIIFGAAFDPALEGKISASRWSATGMDGPVPWQPSNPSPRAPPARPSRLLIRDIAAAPQTAADGRTHASLRADS